MTNLYNIINIVFFYKFLIFSYNVLNIAFSDTVYLLN